MLLRVGHPTLDVFKMNKMQHDSAHLSDRGSLD